MKKIIFRKLLIDCLIFFLLSLISLSIIIWVFQSVNYLDIIIDDGKDYKIYLSYSILNFPKILSRVLPFAIFFSFSYVLNKYELNNELLIFWSFGISKIKVVNFFLVVSVFITFVQLSLSAYFVPMAQDVAKSLLRNSNINIFENFIKTKNFNDNIKGLTIYIENKNKNGNLNNIYLKKQNSINNFQITHAKKGYFTNKQDLQILVLLDGETFTLNNDKITNFTFSQTDYNLSNSESNTSTYVKTQEMLTTDLIRCVIFLTDFKEIKIKKLRVENCKLENIQNIYKELYKRLISPFYLPILILISLMLIIQSKEKINFTKYSVYIFLFGFIMIIFSETILRFISNSFFDNIKLILLPIFIIIIFYLFYIYKLNFIKYNK